MRSVHRRQPASSSMRLQPAPRNPVAPTTVMVAGSEPAVPGAGGHVGTAGAVSWAAHQGTHQAAHRAAHRACGARAAAVRGAQRHPALIALPPHPTLVGPTTALTPYRAT